jgi:multicomponent K+:H+ antiporter subunit A/multicomponent Na+:H+ antiporter subunit A
MNPELLLLAAVLVPLLAAIPAVWLGLRLRAPAGRLLAFAFTPALALVALIPQARLGRPVEASLAWVPGLNLDLLLRADGFSLVFALLVSGIGFLIMFYAASYLGRDERSGRFYSWLLLFGGAMLGLVLTDNLIALFGFWELTSITSFLLIGFWDSRKASQDGAVKAFVITALGGLALLAAVVVLGLAGGTWRISELDWILLQGSPLFPVMVTLLLLAAFTKSAQLPFHLWLPTAMEAPTPVSAYLHSATMVKGGVLLLAKFGPLLQGTAFSGITLYVGLATMLWGSYLALRQSDLKALLAYSTVSQLGLLVALYGSGATFAATAHLVNHAAFKAALFMVVGIIDHQLGSRDVRVLSGLRRILPFTFILALPAALSMAGLPPFGGFISKELLFGVMLAQGPVATTLAVLAGIMTFAYSLKVLRVFVGPLRIDGITDPVRAPLRLSLPVVPLAAATVLFGVFPWQDTAAAFFTGLARPSFGYAQQALTLWHGFTLPLFLSMATWLGGTLLLRGRHGFKALQERLTPSWNANTIYYAALNGLVDGAAVVTRRTQGASFASHVRIMFLAVAGIGLFLGLRYLPPVLTPVPASMWIAVLVLVAGTYGVISARSRLTLLVFMGLVGYGTALFFVLMRAPDLALTQLLIETVTVILFLSVFRFLPQLRRYSRPPHLGMLDVTLGVGVGLAVVGLLLAVQAPVAAPISDFYLRFSKTLAGGENVVNVLLVDFRGYDTMGEITVLAVVAVSVYALLRLRSRAVPSIEEDGLEEE